VLGVAHHALAGCFYDSGELASSDERRRRCSGIAPAGGHGVGKIHTHGFNVHDDLARLGLGVGYLAHFQNFRTTGTGNDDSFHEIYCTTGAAGSCMKSNAREMYCFMSRRCTTASSIPCCSRNSLRWKPSGSFWRIVCSMTRGPAKPMSAPGSAMFKSPSMAKDAVVPPVVGSVITEMYGTLASSMRESEDEIFASCMRLTTPSIMRAPPEAETTISGSFSAVAFSTARVIISPTTAPMEPPMNEYSMTLAMTGLPWSLPRALMTASLRPVSFCERFRRSA